MDGFRHEVLVELGRCDAWEPAYDGMTIDVGGPSGAESL